ncbi:MAG: hypothetical protein J6W25_01950 [Bacilli bacterium]|nr:hypothetical protein [Bacilli bacterium]
MKLNKQLFKSICMLAITGIMFLGCSFLYLSITFGWLAGLQGAEGDGMHIISETDEYEIYIAKTTKYDDNNVYEGIDDFKNELKASGKAFNETDPAVLYTNSALALELDNEVMYENVYFLVPGSYGTFTLYIKPLVEGDINISFDIELSGYKKSYNESTNELSLVIPENDDAYNQALDMLKGHILFFGSRTMSGGQLTKFSNFLGNHITYNTAGKSMVTVDGEDYYKLTIYWEWPLLYSDIIHDLQSDDPNNKYPAAVGTYISSHPEYFFATNADEEEEDLLSDGYNDGDQLIGDNIHFLVITLK